VPYIRDFWFPVRFLTTSCCEGKLTASGSVFLLSRTDDWFAEARKSSAALHALSMSVAERVILEGGYRNIIDMISDTRLG
jgi:hypothetical protein